MPVEVPHYPLLDEMRQRPESQDGEVHQTPPEDRDSAVNVLAKLVDYQADKNVKESICPDPFLDFVLLSLGLSLLAHLRKSDSLPLFS